MFGFGAPVQETAEFYANFCNVKLGPFRVPDHTTQAPATELKLNGRNVTSRHFPDEVRAGARIEFRFPHGPSAGLLEIAQREGHVFPWVEFFFCGKKIGAHRPVVRRVRCHDIVIDVIEPVINRQKRLSGWMYARLSCRRQEEDAVSPLP